MKVKTFETTKRLVLSAPLPLETKSYKPVPHKQVIETVLEGIDKAGLELDKEIYSSSYNGDVVVGRYTIKNNKDDEMQQQFVWENSYNKMKPLSFSYGANILVCTNGLIAYRSGYSFRRKHTGDVSKFGIDTIYNRVLEGAEVFTTLQKNRDQMKEVEVSKRLASELLGRLYFEEKLLGSTSLNIIKKEFDKPSHDYSAPGTLWELYQFVTFSIGGINPGSWVTNHLKAHEFFCSCLPE